MLTLRHGKQLREACAGGALLSWPSTRFAAQSAPGAPDPGHGPYYDPAGMHAPPQHTRTRVNACGAARAAHLRLRARQRRRGHRGGEQRVYAAGRQRARARDRLGRRARPRAAVEAPRVGARPPQRLQLRRGSHQRRHALHRALQHGLCAHHGSGSAGSGTRCWTSGRVVVHARALVATGVAAAGSHQARPMHSQPPGCAARRRRPASAALPPGSACGAGRQRSGRARPCACNGARTAPRPLGGARRRRGAGGAGARLRDAAVDGRAAVKRRGHGGRRAERLLGRRPQRPRQEEVQVQQVGQLLARQQRVRGAGPPCAWGRGGVVARGRAGKAAPPSQGLRCVRGRAGAPTAARALLRAPWAGSRGLRTASARAAGRSQAAQAAPCCRTDGARADHTPPQHSICAAGPCD